MEASDDPFVTIQREVKASLEGVPDVLPSTLADRLRKAIETQVGPLPPAPPVTGATIRAACRFCHGTGCLHCDTLAAAEYRRQFPQGAQPLMIIPLEDPTAMARLRDALHALLNRGVDLAADQHEERDQ